MSWRRSDRPRYRIVTVRVDEETWGEMRRQAADEPLSTWMYRRLLMTIGGDEPCRASDRSR